MYISMNIFYNYLMKLYNVNIFESIKVTLLNTHKKTKNQKTGWWTLLDI